MRQFVCKSLCCCNSTIAHFKSFPHPVHTIIIEFLFFSAELSRDLDLDIDILVTNVLGSQIFDAIAFDPELLTRLCAGRNRQFDIAIGGRNIDHGS